MLFASPSWVPSIPDVPESQPVGDFALGGDPNAIPQYAGRPPLVCASTGREYSLETLRERTEALARSLCKKFGWSPNEGQPWDKVVTIFSLNTVSHSTFFQSPDFLQAQDM